MFDNENELKFKMTKIGLNLGILDQFRHLFMLLSHTVIKGWTKINVTKFLA